MALAVADPEACGWCPRCGSSRAEPCRSTHIPGQACGVRELRRRARFGGGREARVDQGASQQQSATERGDEAELALAGRVHDSIMARLSWQSGTRRQRNLHASSALFVSKNKLCISLPRSPDAPAGATRVRLPRTSGPRNASALSALLHRRIRPCTGASAATASRQRSQPPSAARTAAPNKPGRPPAVATADLTVIALGGRRQAPPATSPRSSAAWSARTRSATRSTRWAPRSRVPPRTSSPSSPSSTPSPSRWGSRGSTASSSSTSAATASRRWRTRSSRFSGCSQEPARRIGNGRSEVRDAAHAEPGTHGLRHPVFRGDEDRQAAHDRQARLHVAPGRGPRAEAEDDEAVTRAHQRPQLGPRWHLVVLARERDRRQFQPVQRS